MRTWYAQLLGIVAILAGSTAFGTGAANAQGVEPTVAAPTTAPDAAAARTPAAIVTLQGVIDDYRRDELFKRFDQARQAGAKVVILKLDTPGGLVTAGLDISRFLKRQDDLHVIAHVHEKAYSAGIMIGLACDELVMEPGSYIGDAAPIVMGAAGGIAKLEGAERAKAESPILADFHDSAVKNGHDPLLAEAMVSYGRVVRWVEKPAASDGGKPERRFVNAEQFEQLTKDGWREVSEAGVPAPIDGPDTLLTVSAAVAEKIGLSKATVASPQALAAQRGYAIVGEFTPGTGEKLVALLSSPAVRGLLLIVFFMSLYIGLHTPGAGGAEAIAMISLGTLIGVPLLTGYAQWWEIAAILVGLVLVALELFVIPGFGVAGIAGIVLLLGGVVMTFVGNAPGLPGTWRLPQVWAGLQNGLLAVVVAFAVSGMLALWLRKYLPRLPYLNRLVLQPAGAPAGALVGAGGLAGGTPLVASTDAWPFVGTIGRATTDLKPGGSAEFPYADDRRATAVVSDSGYVSAGTKLVVREVHGSRVVVRAAV